jgi:hypothetical protein
MLCFCGHTYATQDSQLLLALGEPLITAAKAQNQLQVDRMLSICQQGAALQQQADEKAGQLRDLFYSLMAQLKEARAACVSRTGALLQPGLAYLHSS